MIFLMGFLSWHYSEGLNSYLRRWYFLMAWVVHYFSLPLLIPTMFSPWKRLTDTEEIVGLNIEKIFEQFTFNVISRGIGAVVRLSLLFFGTLAFIPTFVVGIIGLIFWVSCPFIGIPYFLTSDKNYHRYFLSLIDQLIHGKHNPVGVIFDSSPGKFVSARIGADHKVLVDKSDHSALNFAGFSPGTFESFMDKLIGSGVWSEEALKSENLDFVDLKLAARWWDTVYNFHDPEDEKFHLSRPGLGLELLFGYTPQLNKYATDLSLPQNFSHHLIGRESLVNRMERELTGGSSIVLVGQPGVGKRTVVLEFARRAMAGELGSNVLYKRVLEFDYNFLLSQSLDVSQKKTRLSAILQEASDAGNVILVIKDLHRLTHVDVEGMDFTDLFEKHLEKRKLKIIAISSAVEYERFLLPNSRLRKYFQPVEVVPTSKEDALLILFEFASLAEKYHRITFTIQSLREMIDGADKYLTETPFPEKVLELLDHVVVYLEKNRKTKADPEDVMAVISEQTGISLSRLTEGEKKLLGDLEEVLHQNLVGQDIAVSLISKSLRARTVGTKSEDRPIGSFLFLGPTGVGKTQTAKTLTNVYFGSHKYLLRFDMSEFAGSEGMAKLIGSQERNEPGQLTSAIRKQPASLLLLDEIEKAPREILNLFLTLLDEGEITDAFGKKISCKNLFVIATSNAGAEVVRQLVSQGVTGEQLQKEVVEHIQKSAIFSPEFLNRFDGVVVFQPLSEDELKKIARLMLSDIKDNLYRKNIHLEITDALCEKIAREGHQPQFGARPMRRIVDLTLGDVLGKAILGGQVKAADHIEIIPLDEPDKYEVKVVR